MSIPYSPYPCLHTTNRCTDKQEGKDVWVILPNQKDKPVNHNRTQGKAYDAEYPEHYLSVTGHDWRNCLVKVGM
jgi:hypothetical protein